MPQTSWCCLSLADTLTSVGEARAHTFVMRSEQRKPSGITRTPLYYPTLHTVPRSNPPLLPSVWHLILKNEGNIALTVKAHITVFNFVLWRHTHFMKILNQSVNLSVKCAEYWSTPLSNYRVQLQRTFLSMHFLTSSKEVVFLPLLLFEIDFKKYIVHCGLSVFFFIHAFSSFTT